MMQIAAIAAVFHEKPSQNKMKIYLGRRPVLSLCIATERPETAAQVG
jgi:hypothetical protein